MTEQFDDEDIEAWADAIAGVLKRVPSSKRGAVLKRAIKKNKSEPKPISKKYVRPDVALDGPPCHRCQQPTEICRHAVVTAKMLRQPYYHSQWYRCCTADCKTTLIMPEEFRVYREAQETWGKTSITSMAEAASGNTDERPPWE